MPGCLPFGSQISEIISIHGCSDMGQDVHLGGLDFKLRNVQGPYPRRARFPTEAFIRFTRAVREAIAPFVVVHS